MADPALSPRAIEFLAIPRLGMFSTAASASTRGTNDGGGDGWNRPVPVWFSCDDGAIELFSGATSPKVARLRAEPRAHLLAANNMGEAEAWVSITGAVDLHPVDPTWLEALSARYWDLADATARTTVDGWLGAVDTLIGITIRPDEVRSYGL